MIQLLQPCTGSEEARAVSSILESQWIGKGSVTDRFEAAFSEKLGISPRQMIATNSATSALFTIAQFLSWKEGDEVILPSISFVGAANAVAAAGGKIVFADVHPHSLNLTVEAFKKAISKKTKALLLLHYGGFVCEEIEEISNLCREREIRLIVDNACSPFSTFGGIPTGCFTDFGVWSFDPVKIMTCGDGGMIYAKQEEEAEALRRRINMGLSSFSGASNTHRQEWWNFEVSSFSERSITNDIASAIGLEQLKKVPTFLKRREEIDAIYNEAFKSLPGVLLHPGAFETSQSSYYMYWIQLEKRNELANFLLERGIYTSFRYMPLHRLKIYKSVASLPGAEKAHRTTLNLPLHPSLSPKDLQLIIQSVCEFVYRQ